MELPFSLCELQSRPWEGDLKQGHLEGWQPKGSGIILVMATVGPWVSVTVKKKGLRQGHKEWEKWQGVPLIR